jgi:hypothetical protein
MNRCTNCNGALRDDEVTCFVCGDAVKLVTSKVALRERFRTGVKIAFYFSCVLTVASIFLSDYTPSFVKCLTSTIILLLVKSSADQMFENRQS